MTLLGKDFQNSNSEESSENRETLFSSRFEPATCVNGLVRLVLSRKFLEIMPPQVPTLVLISSFDKLI